MRTGALLPAAQPDGEQQYRADEIVRIPESRRRSAGSFSGIGWFIGWAKIAALEGWRPEVVVDEEGAYVLVAVKVRQEGGK